MPTPISPKLRRRLETMKELKQEFYVGSKDAFDYLKSIAYYENLLDEVYKDNSVKTRITIREASNLQNKIIFEARRHLGMASVLYSDAKSLSVSAEHYVESPLPSEFEESAKLIIGERECHCWKIDIPLFLKKFLNGSKNIQNLSNAIFLFFAVEGDNIPFFIYGKDDRRFSLRDIINDPELRKCSEKMFWSDCYSLYVEIDDPHYKEYLSQGEIGSFKKAYKNEEKETCHNILQKIRAGQIDERLSSLEEEETEDEYLSISKEEFEHLLDARKLFLRAEREYGLGLFDVERRIALNFLYSFKAKREDFKSISEFVDSVIELTLDRIKKRQLQLEMGKFSNAPTVIIKSFAESLRFYEYVRLALIQNRNWLIEFLSK